MVRKDRRQVTAIIISVIAAFVMWLYVMGDKNPPLSTILEVPVALVNQENIALSNLALIPDQTFYVNMKIHGNALDIYKVMASDFRVVADMGADIKKGENKVPVDIISRPKGISVEDEGNLTVKVKLDSMIEKQVPIKINVIGKAKTGFSSLPVVARPSEVWISGPASYVNSVAQVTGQVDINGFSMNVNSSIPVRAQDSEGNDVSNAAVEPKYVDVTVPIKPSKEVSILVKTTGSLPEGKLMKSIKPDIDKVTLIGDSKYLNSIELLETIPYDLSRLKASTKGELLLNIPAGVSVAENLRSINVSFTVENIIEKVVTVTINYNNKSDAYNYSFADESVQVVVRGGESIINNIDASALSAVVDLMNAGEGTLELPVNVSAPGEIEVASITPEKVTLTVAKK